MKKLIYIFLICLLAGCGDDENALIFNNDEINGVAYLKDPFFESNTKIAPGVIVFLHNGDDTKNYLLKTDADKEGKFRFVFQPRSNGQIKIVSEFRDSASILFTAKTNAFGFKDSLILNPQYNKGLIKIKTKDVNGVPLAGMNVYVFTNPNQAESARTGTPVGAIRTMKSNERAVAFFHGLAPDNYYVVGKKDSLTATLVDTVVISAIPTSDSWIYKSTKSTVGGVELTSKLPLEIRLYEAPVLYTVLVKSNKDQPLAGIEVYMFTSLAQANSVKKQATDFIMKQKTSSSGKAEFRRLPPGSVYLAANGKFMGTDSLIVKSAIDSNSVTFPISTPLNDIPSRNRKLIINTD